MTTLFKKLNLKDHKEIILINAPDSFEGEANAIGQLVPIITDYTKVEAITFCLSFNFTINDIEQTIKNIADKLEGDAVIWFCYPKKSSKKYTSEIHRDQGWEIMGDYDLEGVRLVAIDEDWSALRWRKVEYIKKMTRDKKRTYTKAGKSKTKSV